MISNSYCYSFNYEFILSSFLRFEILMRILNHKVPLCVIRHEFHLWDYGSLVNINLFHLIAAIFLDLLKKLYFSIANFDHLIICIFAQLILIHSLVVHFNFLMNNIKHHKHLFSFILHIRSHFFKEIYTKILKLKEIIIFFKC